MNTKRMPLSQESNRGTSESLQSNDSLEPLGSQAETTANVFPSLDTELSSVETANARDVGSAISPPNPCPKVGGAESPPTPCTLNDARLVFGKWLDLADPDVLDVLFGTVMAHRIDGDPVWLFVVGAPGDGKTELLRSLPESADIYRLSTLSSKSLISGNLEGPDHSLLPKLDGKVLVVKDFTTIIEMASEERAAVLGMLRDAYDGEAAKAFGSVGTRSYKSRFGFLAGVTPAIDRSWATDAQLGERFLKFRLPNCNRLGKVKRALSGTNSESHMRSELSEAAARVLAQTPTVPSVPAVIENKIIALADCVSLIRSHVSRDRRGDVDDKPVPEVGTRVGKALKKLAIGIAMARGETNVTDNIYRIVKRVGLDSVPSIRSDLLSQLWKSQSQFESASVIATQLRMPTDTVTKRLEDLNLLGIVDRHGDPRAGYRWRLSDAFIEHATAAELFQ